MLYCLPKKKKMKKRLFISLLFAYKKNEKEVKRDKFSKAYCWLVNEDVLKM